MTAAPTRQLLDPAGTLAAYPMTMSLAILAFVTGLVTTVGSLVMGVGNPALVILGLVLFTGSCVVVAVAANPYRAPFTVRSSFLVHVLAVLAYAAASSATLGQGPAFFRGGWVVMGICVLIIAVSPYRPVHESVAAGSITATFVALVTFAKAEADRADLPLAVAAGTAVAVLSICFGAATYSAATIRALQQSRRRADVASDALSTELSDGIARLVREDRATILERDVKPFFAEIVASSSVTSAQKERARQISDAIRVAMVAEADRSWLDALLARSGSRVLCHARIDDPDGVASAMNTAQRTAIRAFLVAAGGDRRARNLSVDLFNEGSTLSGIIRLHLNAFEGDMRETYGPYLAVMRVAFTTAPVQFDHPFLIVRFTFDRA